MMPHGAFPLLFFSAFLVAVPDTAAAQGPVILMGIDAEDGNVSSGAHGGITPYADVMRNGILDNITNGGHGILVIGGGKNAPDHVTRFWNEVGEVVGQPVTHVNGEEDITSQSFVGFAVIAVASSEMSTPSGGLTDAENDAFALRAEEVLSFVNGGGGLFGLSQSFLSHPYGYLERIGSFTSNFLFGSFDDIEATPEGEALGITDENLDVGWHNEYLTFPVFMDVLATNVATGEACAIGRLVHTIDFDTEDDFVTTLVNGQAITSPQEFGRRVQINGFGPNTYGTAIFDSDPTGPNAGGSDRDLLVDRGNILILQENPSQSTPDVYDDPDDAQLGGLMVFDFLEPVELRSVDLIDICPGLPSQNVMLTVFDQAAHFRTYFVPGGWTNDLFMDGPPGFGTLDLTTLDPQPGFMSTATASQTPPFDPTDVIRLEVFFHGSGALDNLAYDPTPEPQRSRGLLPSASRMPTGPR